MVKSNFDDNNLFTVNISPISSKQEYSCLCEVVEEYGGNLDYLMGKISQAIKKNTLLYQDYSNADHLDIGSHCHAFPSFDLGDGYIAYVGMFWPEMKENLAISLTKEFVLENGGDDMTMGIINPNNTDEPQLAFFTRLFFEYFSDTTKFGKNLFFVDAALNGYISECSGEVRWLFSEGLAFGYKYCKFYVFNEFTDAVKYSDDSLRTIFLILSGIVGGKVRKQINGENLVFSLSLINL